MPGAMGYAAGADKLLAIRSYRQIGTFLRCAEVMAILVLLSWYSSRLPDAFRLFLVFLHRLASLVISTPFVFLLGNAIVLTLFAKSKRQQPSDVSTTSLESHSVYDQLLRAAASNNDHGVVESQQQIAEVVYEDKAICVLESKPQKRRFRRTKSEQMKEKWTDGVEVNKLRRTTTGLRVGEKKKKNKEGDDGCVAGAEAETVMSNEELRRRVEAFIAKERRFRREESMAGE